MIYFIIELKIINIEHEYFDSKFILFKLKSLTTDNCATFDITLYNDLDECEIKI